MGQPPAILGKLIPLLGSDKPGEVVATASAIGRALHGAGLDWHDLAGRALAEPKIVIVEREASRPQSAPVSWRGRLEFCLDFGDFNEREWRFIASLRAWRGTPTEKQLAWLDQLYERTVQRTGEEV
jgi:hypothetical protein